MRRLRVPGSGALALALGAVALGGLVLGTVVPAAASAQSGRDPLDVGGAPAAVRRAVFRAETAVQAGELDRAANILRTALADGHDHPSLRYRLGAYLLATGQTGNAAVHLRAAADGLPPGLTSASAEALWRDLGRAEYEAGEYAAAAGAFTAAWRTARRVDAREAEAGRDPRGPGDDRRLGPAPAELRYYAAVAWSLADRPDSALAHLADLAASAPDTVPQEWVRALVAIAAQAEQPQRASAGADRLLRDHPDRPSAWRLASEQSQLAGDLEAAAVRLQVAHWLRPLPPDDRQRLAELHTAAGAPRQAARVYAEMWADAPADLALARSLAVAWLQAHEPDSARGVLLGALDGVGDGEVDEAGNADDRAAEVARLLALLADLEYGERDWAAASEALRRLLAREPDRGRAWLLLGASELQLGRREQARAALERAAADPELASQARRLLDQLARRD